MDIYEKIYLKAKKIINTFGFKMIQHKIRSESESQSESEEF